MLEQIQQTFNDIKNSIRTMGVPVGDCDSPTTYANQILQINEGLQTLFYPLYKESQLKPSTPVLEVSVSDVENLPCPEGWSKTPQGLSGNIWMSYILVGFDEENPMINWTDPILLTESFRTFVIYAETQSVIDNMPTPNGGEWDGSSDTLSGQITSTLLGSDTIIYWSQNYTYTNGKYYYFSIGTFSSKGSQLGTWSKPIRVTAKDGIDGKDGRDGSKIDFCYKLYATVYDYNTDKEDPDFVPTDWSEQPLQIDGIDYRICAACSRLYDDMNQEWGSWSKPYIYSMWGDPGKTYIVTVADYTVYDTYNVDLILNESGDFVNISDFVETHTISPGSVAFVITDINNPSNEFFISTLFEDSGDYNVSLSVKNAISIELGDLWFNGIMKRINVNNNINRGYILKNYGDNGGYIIFLDSETLIFRKVSNVDNYTTQSPYGKYKFLGSVEEGNACNATGNFAHAEGNHCNATGNRSHAEGSNTNANGNSSHAEGSDTIADNDYSHAEGYGSTVSGVGAHGEGEDVFALGKDSHAEGFSTMSIGVASHAEGENAIAIGRASHAEGSGTSSTSEFLVSCAAGSTIFNVTGINTIEVNDIVEYNNNFAKVVFKNTSNFETDRYVSNNSITNKTIKIHRGVAYGDYSKVEGSGCNALGYCSKASGYQCTAVGAFSQVNGYQSKALEEKSYVNGNNLTTYFENEQAFGSYNESGYIIEDSNDQTKFYISTNASEPLPPHTVFSVGVGDFYVPRNGIMIDSEGNTYVYLEMGNTPRYKKL